MKTIALAGALCLLFASSTLCKANSGPWCAADVAILNFKNYKVNILRGSNFAPSRQSATETREKKCLE